MVRMRQTTDGTLCMHQSEHTIQLSDKQDATTEVAKVCKGKGWETFIRTHCNDKKMYDLYKNGSVLLLPELSGNGTCKNCFGFFSFLMIDASKCQLGALNSESFSERINSATNQIVTKNVVRTDPDFVDKLVTLRMNEKCLAHVQKF